MAIIALLHGPNLNLLGQREPHIYGSATLDDYVAAVAAAAAQHGHTVEAFQSNHEGALVDAIHEARGSAAAIIINPGAFTHYAWAIHDALAAFDGPIIEVHISNPNARDPRDRDDHQTSRCERAQSDRARPTHVDRNELRSPCHRRRDRRTLPL